MADQALTCPRCGSAAAALSIDTDMDWGCAPCGYSWCESEVDYIRSHNKLLAEALAKVIANIRTYTPTTHGELQQADAALAFRGEGKS